MTSGADAERPLRLLVVDDSAFNRRNIAEMLSTAAGVEIAGKAADGEEALRLALQLRPDAITLDLEMPRMDGFTFLRILMSKLPTPVIVVSSYSQKENVFKALELGALDFVAKPERLLEGDLHALRAELVQKVMMVRGLRMAALATRRPLESRSHVAPPPREPGLAPPRWVVGIASSTGGPSALMEVFQRLPARSRAGFVMAQHMPDKFTRTFAERLDKRSAVRVTEAADQDALGAGVALLCPGRQCMELVGSVGDLRVRVGPALPEDRYVPSADRLLASVARVAGSRALGVILTGMGDDGVQGARAILAAGGTVLAESEETAVVYGMPGAAVRAGVVTRALPLPAIADHLATLGA